MTTTVCGVSVCDGVAPPRMASPCRYKSRVRFLGDGGTGSARRRAAMVFTTPALRYWVMTHILSPPPIYNAKSVAPNGNLFTHKRPPTLYLSTATRIWLNRRRRPRRPPFLIEGKAGRTERVHFNPTLRPEQMQSSLPSQLEITRGDPFLHWHNSFGSRPRCKVPVCP